MSSVAIACMELTARGTVTAQEFRRVVRRLLLLPAALAGSAAAAVVPALGQSAGPTVHATTDNTFKEARIAVKPGTTVHWVNDGGFHNVHFEDGFNQPPSSSPPPAWGAGVDRTFAKAGEYAYVCDAHASIGMKGTVYVNDAATVPATATETQPTAPSGGGDTQAPALRATARRSTRAAGLAVRVRLGESATVTATVSGPGGRRTVRRKLAAGARTLVLVRRPRPGRYRVTLRAADAAGNASRAVHISLTVPR
jgi:plastocyanin